MLQGWAWRSSSPALPARHASTGGCHLPASRVWDLLWARLSSPSGPDFVFCDQQQTTTVAQNSLGFGFISPWHKG